MLSLLASPLLGRLPIGPVGLSADGLMIALGVVAGTALALTRFERAGSGFPVDSSAGLSWARTSFDVAVWSCSQC
jgi:hypothetical protein